MRLFAAFMILLACLAPPAQAKDDDVPYFALAPLALSTGYIYAGRWDRAIIAPFAVTTLVAGGAMAGFLAATGNDSMKDPIGACLGILVLPAAGGAIGLGIGTTAVLIDQSLLPGGGWVAPAITAGTLIALAGLQAWQPGHVPSSPLAGEVPDRAEGATADR